MPFDPRTAGLSVGGATGPGGGVGAVPKVMLIGAAADAPEAALIAVWTMVTVYGVFAERWCAGEITRSLFFQANDTLIAG